MIHIPGYRILREVGRGDMSTVHLALRQSDGREVALKVLVPAPAADPGFSERVLKAACDAADLRHPHLVDILDFGRAGDACYVVMEHLGGGPALGDGTPRDAACALRIAREIAGALDHAHRHGLVHGAVHPGNILLRGDGAAVLTDCGIARAAGMARPISPEQARGLAPDARSDLYGLGLVLHELLSGRAPYAGADPLAVAIMRLTGPPPPLPPALSALQPLLDGLLTISPDQRLANGDRVASAIRMHETAPASGGPSSAPVVPAPPARRGARAEPVFGEIDAIDDGDPRRRDGPSRAPPERGVAHRMAALVAVLGIGAGIATLWAWQDHLRALLPDTRWNTLLAEGQRAMEAGRLAGDDVGSALQMFRAVLREDPDNATALAGVREVGERLAALSAEALAAGDRDIARARLAQAREVLQGGARIDTLERDLAALESKDSELAGLLEQASAARDAGRLTDAPDSAAALFARALAAEPGNGIARKGLDDIVAALDAQARAALDEGRPADAEALATRIESVSPGHAAVPALRGRVADARAAAAQALEEALTTGEARLREGRLLAPEHDSARHHFQQALARDPGNARARAGLSRIGAALLLQADAAIEAGDAAGARRRLREARTFGASAGDADASRLRLRELEERLAIAAERPPLTADQQARLERFLAEADAALAADALNEPPGGNAYDLYRAALSLDRGDQRARDGLAAIAPRARALFDEAVAAGRPAAARPYLDAFESTSRDGAARNAMRLALGRAYAAQGERQAAAGQREAARRSLARAREMAPDDPAVAALAARLAAL